MTVIFFNVRPPAVALEARLYAQAIANGQVCDKWAEIIVDPVLGFGVPIKERVKPACSKAEIARAVEWKPTLTVPNVSSIR